MKGLCPSTICAGTQLQLHMYTVTTVYFEKDGLWADSTLYDL